MFESGSRRSYSFRPDLSKTKDSSSSNHSLTKAVAGSTADQKVVLKSSSSLPVAGQTTSSSDLITSNREPVENGRRSVVHRLNAKEESLQLRTEKNDRRYASLGLKNTTTSEVERLRPRSESLQHVTTKSLSNTTNGRQDHTRGSDSTDLGNWSMSSGQWSDEVVRGWSSEEGPATKLSVEDNETTEVNNNTVDATDNAVASDLSDLGHTDDRDDHHADQLNENSTHHSADHSTDSQANNFNDYSTDHITSNSTDHITDPSRDHASDHVSVHASDHASDHVSDHVRDHLIDHANDEASGHASGHASDHVSDHVHVGDHSPHLSINQTGNGLSHLRIGSDGGAPRCHEGNNSAGSVDAPDERDAAAAAEPEHPYFVRIAAESAEPTPILSNRGTIRGVRNLVRSGIATLLNKHNEKKTVNYAQLERGRVVFYTTSVTAVRDTFENCLKVKRILQTQMVDFEERNVFISKDFHQELCERLQQQPGSNLELPQVFVDGYHLGDAKEIDRLNESGVLRKIFNNFKKVQHPKCCTRCGGHRYVPCISCHGSKKSRRGTHLTAEFYVLRCTSCDENGLVKCELCNSVITGDNDDPR